ncbi:Ldh family oxidoreductase, partial [Rhizobium leguminosarum]
MPMPLSDSIALTQFAKQIVTRAGMEPDKAETTAAVRVEGYMIGHETHGVSLLNWYGE